MRGLVMRVSFGVVPLLLVGVLALATGAFAQDYTLDLAVEWINAQQAEVTIYGIPTGDGSAYLYLETSDGVNVQTWAIEEDTPLIVEPPDPLTAYQLRAEWVDVNGIAQDISPIEVLQYSQESVTEIEESPPSLSLTIDSLDPSNCELIYANVRVDGAGVVLPESAFQVFEDGVLQTQSFQVETPQSDGGSRIADFVFLVDCSGSMGGEQASVRSNLSSFARSLESSGIDFRLGLVTFGQSYHRGNPVLINGGVMTGDANDFIDHYLNHLSTEGGREPGLQAVIDACSSYPFRPGSQRHFLLITDEDSDGGSLSTAASCCSSNNVTVHTAVDCGYGTSNRDYCNSGSIRGLTGGLLFNVIGPYGPILDQIGSRIGNTYTVRYETTNPCSNGGQRQVRVVVTYGGESSEDVAYYTPGSAPRIERTPETIAYSRQQQIENVPLTFAVDVYDDVAPGVNAVILHYRTRGPNSFAELSFAHVSGTRWSVELQGSSIQPPGLDYYITATDGMSTVSAPSNDPNIHPYSIAVRPNEVPSIVHTPPTAATVGQPLTITATVTDNTDYLDRVELWYREYGDLIYETTPMTEIGGDQFEATIPASFVTEQGVIYEIRAWDNFGVWSSDGPHVIGASAGCLEYGALRICGDVIEQYNATTQRVSGNVNINDLLWFSGDIFVDNSTLRVQGSGVITLKNIPFHGVVGDIVLYSGDFEFQLLGASGELTDFLESSVNDTFGLSGLNLDISRLELDTVRGGVIVAGTLTLPRVLKSITVDISHLAITQQAGVELSGCVTNIPTIKLRGGLGLSDLELCYDSQNDCFSGHATVAAKIVTISGDAEVCSAELNRIGVSVDIHPGIPIGQTGLYLSGGSGALDHLAKSDPEPILVRLTVDITGALSIGTTPVIAFNEVGMEIQYPEMIKGEGSLALFGCGVSNGSIAYVNKAGEKAIEADGKTDIAEVLIITFNARATSHSLNGESEGIVQIPDGDTVFHDVARLVHISFPIKLAREQQYVKNYEIGGESRIWTLRFEYKVVFSPELELTLNSNLTPMVTIPLSFVVASTDATSSSSQVYTYEVPYEAREVFFRATGASHAPHIVVIAPNGTTYDTDSPSDPESGVLVGPVPGTNRSLVMVPFPYEGRWRVEVRDTDQDVGVEALFSRARPALEVSATESNGNYVISAQVETAEEGMLRFYVDDDGGGLDGVPISSIKMVGSGRYEVRWIPSDVESGSYHFYATFMPPNRAQVAVYAPEVVEYQKPGAPDAPTNLRVENSIDGWLLQWDPVPDVEGYAVYYQRTGREGPADVISLLESASASLNRLTPGYDYRLWVRAYGRNGSWSLSSDPIEAQLLSDTGNNAPSFGAMLPEFIRVGETMEVDLQATDPDGDLLTYTLEHPAEGMSLSSSGVLSWSPPSISASTVLPVAKVSDGRGGVDSLFVRTDVVAADYGSGSIELNRRVYIGFDDQVQVDVHDADLGTPTLTVEARCPETGDSMEVVLHETAVGSGRYRGGFNLEGSGNLSDALQVSEGASIVVQYTDETTESVVSATALWTTEWPLHGELDFDPDTLNQESRGRFVTVYYEPPAPYVPSQVDPHRVLLMGVLGPIPDHYEESDRDGDGIAELSLKFDRQAFQDLVDVTNLQQVSFEAVLYTDLATLPIEVGDEIRVINPHITHPEAGRSVFVGRMNTVTWEIDNSGTIDTFRAYYRLETDAEWSEIGEVDGNERSVDWNVPSSASGTGWVMVDALSDGQVVGTSTVGPVYFTTITGMPTPDRVELAITGSRPNPFNPRTSISFTTPSAGHVRLRVIDVRGRQVATLVDEDLEAGSHEVVWNGTRSGGGVVASGVYIAVLEFDGNRVSHRLTLVR